MLSARATVLALVVCLAAATTKVRLSDVKALHLRSGMMTRGHRTKPVPQIAQKSNPFSMYAPAVVDCDNVGMGDDGAPIWSCKDENMPNGLEFDYVEVSCEGYEHSEDPFILAGSCGLVYSLRARSGQISGSAAADVPNGKPLARVLHKESEIVTGLLIMGMCTVVLLLIAWVDSDCTVPWHYLELECTPTRCAGCGVLCTPTECAGCGVRCTPRGCSFCNRRNRRTEDEEDAIRRRHRDAFNIDAVNAQIERMRIQRDAAVVQATIMETVAAATSVEARHRGRSRSRGARRLRTSSESPEPRRAPPIRSEPRARVSASPSIAYPQPPAPVVVVNAPSAPAAAAVAASDDGPGFFTGLGLGGIAGYAVSAAFASPPPPPLPVQRREVRASQPAANPAAAAPAPVVDPVTGTHTSVARGRTVRR